MSAAPAPTDGSRFRWLHAAVLAGVAVLSRLPQLASPELLVDGDEAILGLMAKHLAEGRAIPLFLYGQSYGLAAVEAAAAAAAFAVAGVGPVAFKSAILALWIAGVLGYYLALARTLGSERGFWIALLIVLHPAWGVASMRAWSGYVTAFAAAGALLAVLSGVNGPHWRARWLLAGALAGVVFLAQPLWLPGVTPFVLLALAARWRPAALAGFAAASAAVVLLARVFASARVHDYWIRPSAGNPDLLGSLPALWEQIRTNVTGTYNLSVAVAAGPVTRTLAAAWLALLALALAIQIYRLAARRFHLWSHVLCAAVLATVAANWVLLDARDARYFLPLAALAAMWVGVEMFALAGRARAAGIDPVRDRAVPTAALPLLLALVAAGTLAMLELRDFNFMWRNPPGSASETARLAEVAARARAGGARHAVSMHPLLQWQLAFYSREAVVARWTSPTDRYPPYVAAVDEAVRAGAPVAIVGYARSLDRVTPALPDPASVAIVDGRYFVYVGADRPLLERLGVRFRE